MTSTARILIVGDEILAGRTLDTNSHWLAGELDRLGVRVDRILVLPDDLGIVAAAVSAHRRAADYLLVCGGLGPTPDDVTREAVARGTRRAFVLHPEADRLLREHYGEAYTEVRQAMAWLPEHCELIPNPITVAPGFVVENVFVFPGIPRLLQAMFPQVRERFRGRPVHTVELETRAREGDYTPLLQRLKERYPDVAVGSYPSLDTAEKPTRLRLRGGDPDRVKEAARWLEEGLQRIPGVTGRSEA